MVREITAFEAEDGSVFSTRAAAAEHDAKCALVSPHIFTEATALQLIKPEIRGVVFDALAPLVAEDRGRHLSDSVQCVLNTEPQNEEGC